MDPIVARKQSEDFDLIGDSDMRSPSIEEKKVEEKKVEEKKKEIKKEEPKKKKKGVFFGNVPEEKKVEEHVVA